MNKFLKKASLGLTALLFSSALWAHGGAAGTDTDQCKFELEKDHWIHYYWEVIDEKLLNH